MKLSEHLAEENVPLAEFARRAGLSAEGLRLIMKGLRQPRRSTAERVREASGGKVTLADLLAESEARS